ncbi:GNAT family N-acetyltransferase [Rhodococcus qingshengii]|uniref:GNAT family N-acetyltransferase n=1 Tax=Rhodococcus TaxID=1827 RepID=UPI000F627D7A|nr:MULTISPECIES: GNAT family N-acetyltransferase [Rhodococcus]AZI60202.1 N-acetyltransferase [Rhodococcus sp. NJ-530]BDQ18146.1 GNAT family N-acetyltransferase [Rhodococcus qingshengii]
MVNIRVAAQTDLPFLREHDSHVAAEELASVVQRGRILIAEDNGNPIGWLRWGLFWDEIPFMNMLTVLSSNRGQGIGRALVTDWEKRMSRAGHSQVLTSTLADESAQNFYRAMGYTDAGVLLLPAEPSEIFLRRDLEPAPDLTDPHITRE